ncbi:beta-ketoacyl-ACP synthase II [Paenibacillus sp. PR3]|uniref:Beta-ketoacyl-ACP synthase II n=1 Tax=Paenibacillus terricola TaxID=2763503 RepID=A0ABR8N4L4_9BACL|nr:beta-ketoacyl-[acyl-carrier-protein] synthase family protein [Paenibacillus terricola]MBD3922206.1 beta-ketoacyl-ACP synthase II [Paenibacillus terricola]
MRKQRSRRVVVTGLGAVTALGSNVGDLWESVLAGKHGIKPVDQLDMTGYMTQIAGEVKEDLVLTHSKKRRVLDRATLFALKASEEALEDAALERSRLKEHAGCVIGTCLGGMNSGELWYRNQDSGNKGNPRLLQEWRLNSIAESLASEWGLGGPVFTFSTACAAGGNALGYAGDLIRAGKAEIMIVGGADALAHMGIAGFHALQSLDHEPCRPYSKDRNGLSLGEGAGILILESEESAVQRGAKIYAEVLGFGLSADGYHPTAPKPDGEGASRAISNALNKNNIAPDQVKYINGHGTGTPKNDSAETNAIKRVFGEAIASLKVSSTKSMIGHLLGAAGAVEGIVTVLSIHHQIIPPTANFTTPDSVCDLDYTPNQPYYSENLDYALSNNFAFGGNNCSVLFGNYQVTHPEVEELNEERIVITGMSQFSSVGGDLDQFWTKLLRGEPNWHEISTSEGVVRKIGKVKDFDIHTYISKRDARKMDRFEQLTVAAAKRAINHAKVEINDENAHRIGIIVGTANGTVESCVNFYQPVVHEGAEGANPVHFPNTVFNQASGLAAMQTNAIGLNTTVVDGHASTAAALCTAYEHLKNDDADIIAVIGTDTIVPTVLEGYECLNVLADQSSKDPQSNVMTLSEGTVAFVLEKLSNAKNRKAHIYGEIKGYGKTFDGKKYARVDKKGQGLKRAMEMAVHNAQLQLNDIQAILATANGINDIDNMEKKAIESCYLSNEYMPYIATAKYLVGESQGAADGFQFITALLALQHQTLPPKLNHLEHNELHPLDKAEKLLEDLNHVLINSSSLTGSNVSVVLSKYYE